MGNKVVKIVICILLMHYSPIKAQEMDVLLIKKGRSFKEKTNMIKVNPTGFYLYKNAIYDLKLKSGQRMNGRLIDIKKDTIYYTTAFNEAVAKKRYIHYDTIPIAVKNLSKLFLISDRSLGLYESINLKKYDFIFQENEEAKSFDLQKVRVYEDDTELFDSGLLLTAQGLDRIFESEGQTYYYEGLHKKPEIIKEDKEYVAKRIGLFPTGVDEVNGLALSLHTGLNRNQDSLKIKGVLLEIEPLKGMAYIFGFMNGILLTDDFNLAPSNEGTKIFIKGLTISAAGSMSESIQSGVTIGGFYTGIYTMKGFSLTGIHTMTYDFNGLMISGVRNQSRVGKGMQIGLFNSCEDLKGIQIGLWNKNGRRSLPFINWQFSKKKEKSKTS